jgi:glycosyltransferase involved in cell wall biosynthesis
MRRKILFVAPHRPNRSPSQRFRFEQFTSFFEAHGYDYQYAYLLSEEDDKVLYSKGNFDKKALMLARSFKQRQEDVKRANQFDIVFIQREAFMTGTTIFERKFAKSKAKVVFDFDDSIWLSNVSEPNKYLNFLKDPAKTARIIKLSDHVIAGNDYLADYARQFNPHVTVIPTTIDTDRYQAPAQRQARDVVTIGWTGSITTIQHFERAIPVLKRLRERYGNKVRFKVIGDPNYQQANLGIQGEPWRAESEVEDLHDIDVGIMPLPHDEWTKGKCGAKGLQYMGVGIPTIMSPVGVNTEIIEHGVNGFLADHDDEWFDTLVRLIEDAPLRHQIGNAGRDRVEARYSVHANAPKYTALFDALLKH